MTAPALTQAEEALVGWWGTRNPNRHARAAGHAYQWAHSTRQGVKVDTIVVHSAESLADISPPDNGAEAVSRYMSNNTRRVSWHATSDSDSVVWDCPPEWTCFHAGGSWNRRSVGIEQAFQADRYQHQPEAWRLEVMNNTAQVVACWCRHFGIPARHVTKTGVPGIVPHGTTPQVPGLSSASVRHDPGWDRDQWRKFMTLVVWWWHRNPVALGMTGARVVAAQRDLNARHGFDLTLDGVFGPATHGAVLRDQKARGAKLTGVWHPVLDAAPVDPPPPTTPPAETDWLGVSLYVADVKCSEADQAIRLADAGRANAQAQLDAVEAKLQEAARKMGEAKAAIAKAGELNR